MRPRDPAAVGGAGGRPAVVEPRAAERREHLERRAALRASGGPGATAYGEPVRTSGTRAPLDGVVATTAVRLGRRGDVHRGGADLARDRGHDVARAPVADHEPPAEGLVERPQATREVGEPGRAGRAPRAPGSTTNSGTTVVVGGPRRPRPRRAATGCPRGAGRGGTSGSSAPGDGTRGPSAPPVAVAAGAVARSRPRWADERRATPGGPGGPAERPRRTRATARSSGIRSACSRCSPPSCGSGSATTGCAPSCCST